MLEQTSTDMQIFVKPCTYKPPIATVAALSNTFIGFVNDVGTFGLNIEVPNVIGNVILMIEGQ
jgi:hypothetical protein